jgi:hypothetical protein
MTRRRYRRRGGAAQTNDRPGRRSRAVHPAGDHAADSGVRHRTLPARQNKAGAADLFLPSLSPVMAGNGFDKTPPHLALRKYTD